MSIWFTKPRKSIQQLNINLGRIYIFHKPRKNIYISKANNIRYYQKKKKINNFSIVTSRKGQVSALIFFGDLNSHPKCLKLRQKHLKHTGLPVTFTKILNL